MAITVASDQTLVNTTGGDAESYTNWTETAAWSTAGVIDGDMFLQGSNTIGARASAAAGPTEAVFWSHLTTQTANLDLTGFHIFFWIKCISLPSMDTRARGGIGLSVSSTAAVALDATAPWTTLPWRGISDSNQWFLTGNDFDGTSGWVCYVVDPFTTPDFARGTPVMTSVDRIGIRAAVLQVVGAGSFKPKNVLWDAIRYGTKLTITGSTGTFQDIFAVDNSTANQFGILRKNSGIFLGGGKLIFGTTGQTSPCVLTDSKQTLVWQDFRVASNFYEIQLVGNTTPNTTTVTLGTYSGGLTSGGCTIRGVGLDTQRLIAPVIVSGGTTYVVGDILTVVGGTGTVAAQFEVYAQTGGVITAVVMKTAGSYSVPPTGTLSVTDARNSSATFTATVVGGSIWTLTASAANQTLNLYGCNLSEMRSAALASTTSVRGCTIINSGAVTSNGALIDSCTFQDVATAAPISATYALIIASTTEMSSVTNCKFVNCNRAIKITAAGSYTFDNLTFSGNTYDIENSSAGAVTINTTNGANPTTYINTGGGSTTIVASVSIAVHVENASGTAIQNAQVYIQKSASGKQWNYTSDTGNNAGDADFIVNEVVDTDIPQGGWLHIWDASSNTKQNYRYSSWATKTFNLPTEITGTADAGGSGTTLIDSAGNFTSVNIQEGDTIRNTTDGSWAIVDEIVSATELTTTALQSGSDNTWSSGDTYSFHRLAITYTDNDDLVDIPIFNGQTNASGNISSSYGGTSLAIFVRIRSNQGASKYVPFQTTGSITADGFNLTAVLTEDTVAA